MVACGSASIRVTDSVVGYVAGAGNTVGASSLGPEPCGSGGPNCAYRLGGAKRKAIIIARNNIVPLFIVYLSFAWIRSRRPPTIAVSAQPGFRREPNT